MTSPDAVTGVPYRPDIHEVSEWSRAIYDHLRDWAASREGKWERWEPGYLLMTITSDNGTEVEPIQIYTADEELTVTFGFWETHLPAPGWSGEDDDKIASAEARDLVEDWLSGRMFTAIYFNGGGQWCGSLSVEADQDLSDRLRYGRDWMRSFKPARIEVRRPRKAEWRHFDLKGGDIVEVDALGD
ncbi:MAG: hypothetical protein ACK41C_00165 [Phenylobacterium sp.]|uniref:hypothetical protein n=1 Tax=Phenylobacterium sp. TaxID=1871053 RepID=UPI003918FA41